MWETIVRSLPYLASLDEASRLDLVSGATLRTFAPGDQLTIAGQPLESVVVVRAGLLEELDERGARKRWLTGGDVVGERECVGRTDARSTIRVRRHAWVVCLDPGVLRRIIETNARASAAMAEAALHQETHRAHQLRPLAFVQSFVAIGVEDASPTIARDMAAVCTHRDSTACMVESPGTDPAALAASLHDAEAGDDAKLVVYYADGTDPGWSGTIAARADCIVDVSPSLACARSSSG